MLADGDPIRWPDGLTDQVDWEAELVAVIGQRMSGVSELQALQGVFGYTAANDVSARDLRFADSQWVFRKPPVFLKAGDDVQVEVEGIGVLRNPVAGPTS